MEVFADHITIVFNDNETIVEAVEMAKSVSRVYGKTRHGAKASFTMEGVQVHVRHDSDNEFLEKTFMYSRDSDTPFDVGPHSDEYTPPFLAELDELALIRAGCLRPE